MEGVLGWIVPTEEDGDAGIAYHHWNAFFPVCDAPSSVRTVGISCFGPAREPTPHGLVSANLANSTISAASESFLGNSWAGISHFVLVWYQDTDFRQLNERV